MKKLTFEFLMEYAQKMKNNTCTERLQRTPFFQKQYDEYKQRRDLHDHIMKTYLYKRNYNLARNLFPLNIDDNISQYVLWVTDHASLDIHEYVRHFFATKRTVVFTNPKEWKSIPTITHHHVFVEEYVASKL